ncbi:GntR family transcriptional regulator [Vibrio cholerae]|nr:GntR family transcriptional regulator [Vibrio cholerae]EKF9238358.1 GntR family transcriptional regulator [Vibrio cholerae]
MKVSNPLTIIAIFAGLAETLATVALIRLPSEIQAIFVYFVMAFPTCIVLLFFWILYHRNVVLYAPSDYQNQDHYLEANNLNEQITEKVDLVFEAINRNDVRVSQVEIDALKSQLTNVVSSQAMSSLSVSILDLLKDGGCTEKRLSEHFGTSRNVIRKSLHNLEDQSLVERVKVEGSIYPSTWKLKT